MIYIFDYTHVFPVLPSQAQDTHDSSGETPSNAHPTENDTNKEVKDEQDTGNGPIQPSVTEHTACRRTACKMKGQCKCMFSCLIIFASLGSSFSPSPSPSPIPTPSHTLP